MRNRLILSIIGVLCLGTVAAAQLRTAPVPHRAGFVGFGSFPLPQTATPPIIPARPYLAPYNPAFNPFAHFGTPAYLAFATSGSSTLVFRNGRPWSPFWSSGLWPSGRSWGGYGGGISPVYWDNSGQYDAAVAAYYQQGYQAQEAMNQMAGEMARAREQQMQAAAVVPPPPQQPAAEHSASAQPATILVFRDGKTRQSQNFAIVGQTLWVFDGQGSRKIALSSLDIPATRKANDDRGLDFWLPDETR